MEIKPGYKQTEIGIVRETWEVVELGKLFSFKNGLNKAKQFFGYGTPIVNYMDVYTKRGLRKKDIAGRVSLSSQEIDNYRVMIGDVLFTRTSETSEEVGISSVVLDELEDTVFSGFVLRARPITTKLQPLFAQYCFSPTHVRKQVISKSTYTTRALTNGKSLSSVVIAIPSTNNEQSNIANSISDIDILITSLEKLIEKKKLIKQGVMQELLTGKRRLPGFSGEWETKRLGTFCAHITTGRKDVNEGNPNGKYPFYTCSRAVTFSDHYSFDTEAILIAGNGDVGTLHYFTGKFEAYQRTYVLSGFNVNARYLVHYLNMNLVPTLCDSKIGTSIPYIKIGDLINMPVLVPMDDEELEYITSVLDDIESDIDMLELQLYKQVLLKQAMMQELLTGRIRLI
jgi:type I restriction enzyme S subunit